ncbi:MAG: hypothetical protein ABJN72_11480 [Sulfitobacter sp.]
MVWHWANLFPLIFLPFKLIVLGVGMFFAIKWHHDQDDFKMKWRDDKKTETDKPPAEKE